jgi:hypothetical protein
MKMTRKNEGAQIFGRKKQAGLKVGPHFGRAPGMCLSIVCIFGD